MCTHVAVLGKPRGGGAQTLALRIRRPLTRAWSDKCAVRRDHAVIGSSALRSASWRIR